MALKFGIIVFPGTWSDTDWQHALTGVLGVNAELVFHKRTKVSNYDCLVLAGGFSYGDHLRPGAIARFSPVMDAVARYAHDGGPIIGSCNGFQVLCEAGLLPGALIRNSHLEFRCQEQHLRIERAAAPFTSQFMEGQVISIPVSHGDGNYYVDEEVLTSIEAKGQIALRYCDAFGNPTPESNPNGSRDNIAGITNEAGNVLGLMPHPERVVEEDLGGVDGLTMMKSIASTLGSTTAV